jgi:hypothetical protein
MGFVKIDAIEADTATTFNARACPDPATRSRPHRRNENRFHHGLLEFGGRTFLGTRNVQKQNRSWSSCFAMIIAEHSAESLTPFDSGVRFANGAERPQQAVF